MIAISFLCGLGAGLAFGFVIGRALMRHGQRRRRSVYAWPPALRRQA